MNVGHSTLPGPAVMDAIGSKFDRIIVISDMCCYTSGWGMLPEAILKYKEVHGKTFVYSINLSSDSQGSQADPGDPTNCLVSGYSPKVFDLIRDFEGGEEGQETPIPTLDQIRGKFIINA